MSALLDNRRDVAYMVSRQYTRAQIDAMSERPDTDEELCGEVHKREQCGVWFGALEEPMLRSDQLESSFDKQRVGVRTRMRK